jgi:hypothetical protein
MSYPDQGKGALPATVTSFVGDYETDAAAPSPSTPVAGKHEYGGRRHHPRWRCESQFGTKCDFFIVAFEEFSFSIFQILGGNKWNPQKSIFQFL